MANTINEIIGVKVAEQIFDVEKLQPGRTWVTELSEEGIVTYYTEYKSRKKINVVKTEVPVQDMRSFFKELYDFVRSAEECFIPMDELLLYLVRCIKKSSKGRPRKTADRLPE